MHHGGSVRTAGFPGQAPNVFGAGSEWRIVRRWGCGGGEGTGRRTDGTNRTDGTDAAERLGISDFRFAPKTTWRRVAQPVLLSALDWGKGRMGQMGRMNGRPGSRALRMAGTAKERLETFGRSRCAVRRPSHNADARRVMARGLQRRATRRQSAVATTEGGTDDGFGAPKALGAPLQRAVRRR